VSSENPGHAGLMSFRNERERLAAQPCDAQDIAKTVGVERG
jgi:hypothetical protein